MSDKYAHGSKSKLVVNSTGATSGDVVLCITKFDWEHKYDKHDVTSTCSGGKKEYQLGLHEITFTLEAKLDLTSQPWTAIQTGNPISVIWYGDGTAADVTIPTAVVESAKVTQAVNDVITYTVTGSSSGAFTLA